MNKKQYLSPTMKVVEVNAQQMICQSVGGSQNEKYEVGSTEGWF